MVGGPAEWKSVRGEFSGQRRDFDTKYMRWGREREPFVFRYAANFIDSTLEPNDQFLISTRDPRIGATPDAIGEDVVGEFKTSKHPMPPSLKDAKGGLEARYYIQRKSRCLWLVWTLAPSYGNNMTMIGRSQQHLSQRIKSLSMTRRCKNASSKPWIVSLMMTRRMMLAKRLWLRRFTSCASWKSRSRA